MSTAKLLLFVNQFATCLAHDPCNLEYSRKHACQIVVKRLPARTSKYAILKHLPEHCLQGVTGRMVNMYMQQPNRGQKQQTQQLQLSQFTRRQIRRQIRMQVQLHHCSIASDVHKATQTADAACSALLGICWKPTGPAWTSSCLWAISCFVGRGFSHPTPCKLCNITATVNLLYSLFASHKDVNESATVPTPTR